MAPFTAGFTDSPMQIVDSFQGFHRFCGVVEATDRTIISRQTSTVPCSGIRLLSPPRGTSITTCASWLKRESTAWSAGWSEYPAASPRAGWSTLRDGGFLPHHDQHIAALQADKLFGKAKARAVHHVRRQANTAEQPGGVFGEDPRGADTESPRRASLSNATA